MEKAKDIIVKQVEPPILKALEALRAKRGLRSRAELIRQLLEEAVRRVEG
jgi:metal-responsive CopG/Arc/MetJ family transcriptional regulator